MSRLRMLPGVLLACGVAAACGSGSLDGGEDGCAEMMPGTWSASGAAFGMDMTMTTSVSGCAATFSDWDMAMSVPDGATISGTDVSFTGTGWDDCTGTLADDGKSLVGECSDGSDLQMALTD